MSIILGSLILLSISYCFHISFRLKIGEALIPAVGTIVVVLLLFGLSPLSFQWGLISLTLLAVVGLVAFIISVINHKERKPVSQWEIVPIIFWVLSCFASVLYFGDHLHYNDEFHQWGAAVKYMLENDRMPLYDDFLGDQYYFGTSLFHLFYQMIGGYNEGNMYASSFLLQWIGILLPISAYKMKDWKICTIYTLLAWFGGYSIYVYFGKGIYTDAAVFCLAGGLTGWSLLLENKKRLLPVLIPGLGLLFYFKPYIGLAFCFYVLFFFFGMSLMAERKRTVLIKKGLFAVVLLMALALLVLYLDGRLLSSGVWDNHAINYAIYRLSVSWSVMAESLFGRDLSRYSHLNTYAISLWTLEVAMVGIAGYLSDEKEKSHRLIVLMASSIASFIVFVLYAESFIISYEESLTGRSVGRYYSIETGYLFLVMLSYLLHVIKKDSKRIMPVRFGIVLMLSIFILGIDEKYVIAATSWNNSEAESEESYLLAQTVIDKLEEHYIQEDTKILFLDQCCANYIVEESLPYYLGDAISSYLTEVYGYGLDGAHTRFAWDKSKGIYSFDELLEEEGYDYVLIWTTNDYLNQWLPKVMDVEGTLVDGGLYRVIYSDGEAQKLTYEGDLY